VSSTLPAPAPANAAKSGQAESSPRVSGRFLHRVFCFPVALSGLLFALAALTVRGRFDDPDMWWHLRMGQTIWTNHAIPKVDLFSYTANHHPIVPHEWLSQALIFGAWRWGGFSGLAFWLCFFSTLLLIAGYLLCSLYSANAKVGFVGAVAIWLFATTGFAVRPHMLGYLFLIVELILIHLGRTRNPHWFFWLPPLFALWINCHGSFFLGILVLGLFIFTSMLRFRAGSLVSLAWNPDCRRKLILATIFSMAALFLNPAGIKQILYPLDAMLNQRVTLGIVEEYQPLQLVEARGIVMVAMLGCILLLPVIRRSEIFFDELLLLILGAWLAASHKRLIFVFGILAAPVLSRQLSAMWEGYDAAKDRVWPNAVFVGVSLLTAILAFPNRQNLEAQVVAGSPVKALEFTKTHNLAGPMLNDFVYGGYLMWAAPEYPVFVDGRSDIYEWTGVLAEFSDWSNLQTDPNALLNKYGVQFCLISNRSPMARVLPLLHGWKAVYSDQNSLVFQRITRAHVESTMQIPSQNSNPTANPAHLPTR
jgi:hypothetical protein